MLSEGPGEDHLTGMWVTQREGKGRGGSQILLAPHAPGEEVKLSCLADCQGKKKLPETEG